ncbi:MAG TPA: 3-deoxy-D-manno-octulosonic acid transferase [Vicinamibacteria bacterium]|nr:3-deoxy-D-manno-octulosonic acid transferase [Vicinamibacteria bacterium]
MYSLYSALLALAFMLAVPYFLWKGRATGKYRVSFRERMGSLPPDLNPDRTPSIWIHAVSVGEVLTARVLLGPLRERFPQLRLVVSTTTVTGHSVARSGLGEADALFFAPFDFRGPVRKALASVNPRLLLLMETELWPNLIHEARRAGVRIVVANGRLSAGSCGRYRRIRFLLRHVLAEVDLFLMQGSAHAERARAIGAPPDRVRVAGNLKFDAIGEQAAPAALARLLAPAMEPGPLLVAGSTMPGEEVMVLTAFRQVRARFPQARLILVPRHPERFAEAEGLVQIAGLSCVRRTTLAVEPWSVGDVLLLDTMGELASIYPAAEVVFVGGSLVPSGGHNVLEPAAAGKAVVVGPHMENFQEIADQFRSAGALVQVAGPERLAEALLELLADPARRREVGERARSLLLESRGAVGRTVEALAELLA